MTAEQYRPIYDWFAARPAACRLLRLTNKALPPLVAATYLALLGVLGWDWVQKYRTAMMTSFTGYQTIADEAFWRLVRAVLVPAAVLVIGSVLRKAINAPRPYQQPGFVPLVAKSKTGSSLPSRHSFSAGCLMVVGWWVHPLAGAWLTAAAVLVCVTRVLVGVHHIRDVAAGLVLGAALCAAGLFLL